MYCMLMYNSIKTADCTILAEMWTEENETCIMNAVLEMFLFCECVGRPVFISIGDMNQLKKKKTGTMSHGCLKWDGGWGWGYCHVFYFFVSVLWWKKSKIRSTMLNCSRNHHLQTNPTFSTLIGIILHQNCQIYHDFNMKCLPSRNRSI